MAEEPPRERLFDVLMRRLEILAPHKAAVRSLLRSAARNPGLAFALNGLAVRSQQWMLTAADIGAAGPRGTLRAQGLALLFAQVLRTWVHDDDPGLARTMAALDRGLARGQRWSGFLDDLFRIPPPRAACVRAGAAAATMPTRNGLSLDRHPHRRAQPAQRAVRQEYVAAVGARDVARDREPETGAAFVLIARVVEPQERLEHLLAQVRRDAGAVVVDGDGEPAVVALAGD